MKKYFIYLVVFISLITACKDNPTEPVDVPDTLQEILAFYRNEAKMPAIIGGIIANSTKDENSSFRRDMTGGVFITGGIASSIASIPFFISAGKYKKRAAALVFNNNKIFIPKYNQEVANFQPTLSLKIQL